MVSTLPLGLRVGSVAISDDDDMDPFRSGSREDGTDRGVAGGRRGERAGGRRGDRTGTKGGTSSVDDIDSAGLCSRLRDFFGGRGGETTTAGAIVLCPFPFGLLLGTGGTLSGLSMGQDAGRFGATGPCQVLKGATR